MVASHYNAIEERKDYKQEALIGYSSADAFVPRDFTEEVVGILECRKKLKR